MAKEPHQQQAEYVTVETAVARFCISRSRIFHLLRGGVLTRHKPNGLGALLLLSIVELRAEVEKRNQ
jgi:hypothetical protein